MRGLLFAVICLAIACGASQRDPGFAQALTPDTVVCAGDAGTVPGLDVSTYDGTVDWHAVADAGYRFAIARVSDGLNHPDNQFAANWAGSRDAGLIRGAYQYFEPNQDPQQQAQMVLNAIPDFGAGDLPPVIDVETLDALDGGIATAAVVAWVNAVHGALGVKPIIYTSQNVWSQFGNQPLAADLWVANWQVSCPAIPSAFGNWILWQWADNVTVPGITAEPTDVDRWNGTYAQLEAYVGLGGGAPDAGSIDAGAPDAGSIDAGSPDAGAPDAGSVDAGAPDAGSPDAGSPDAGPIDAGAPDAGTPDAGAPDAGAPDAGSPDAGGGAPAPPPTGGCGGGGCGANGASILGMLGAVLYPAAARRRRQR